MSSNRGRFTISAVSRKSFTACATPRRWSITTGTTKNPSSQSGAFFATAWRLGRYYRTYPAYVQDEVTAALDDPSQFVRGPRATKRGTASDDRHAFVVEDGRYLSARWPGDSYLFARRFDGLLNRTAG